MENFEFQLATKIYYGEGQLQRLGSICGGLGMKKVMVVSGGNVSRLPLIDKILASLLEAGIEYETFFDVPSDPDVDVVDELTLCMKKAGVDGAVAVGGGSPLDAAKAGCILQTNPGKAEEYVFGGGKTVKEKGLPLVCIPTTAGTGSEVTGVAVLGNHRTLKKASISSALMKPSAAILDPVAVKDAPKGVTASTGMDALTHAIEAYVCKKANLFSDFFAEKAIELIRENLILSYEDGENLEARGNMLLASNFAAIAMSHSGLGAVHGIAQAIGGVAGTAHGITNAVLLPYVVKVNYPGNPQKYDKIEELLGMKVEELGRRLAIPEGTGALGVKEEMFPKILEETMAYRQLAVNPVTITEEIAKKLIQESF